MGGEGRRESVSKRERGRGGVSGLEEGRKGERHRVVSDGPYASTPPVHDSITTTQTLAKLARRSLVKRLWPVRERRRRRRRGKEEGERGRVCVCVRV